MNSINKAVLETKKITKSFGNNVVLKDVSISCYAGKTLGLLGENGAGKSTLMNIVSGALRANSGQILYCGEEVAFNNSMEALDKGIAFVHQELSSLPTMTVGENIMMGREPKKGLFIDQRKLHAKASEILNEIGFSIDPDRMLLSLSPAERQMTEIAKAWAVRPKVMIFDEPTSSLNKAESVILFDFISRIKKLDVAVVLISHRMEDIFTCCDYASILKDGELVLTTDIKDIDESQLIAAMVGRELSDIFPKRNQKRSNEIMVELKDASLDNKLKNINIQIPKGSVIGIGGLEGQGQRELCRALFGVSPFTSGKYFIKGKEVHIKSTYDAIAHKMAFVPDDRKNEGLILNLSTQDNIVSVSISDYAKAGIVDFKKIASSVGKAIEQLNIKVSSPNQIVKSLSGGNQQKVVFSKWLDNSPEILYLQEPTRGVDVEAKVEIYKLIRKLTENGACVVVFTSDLMELIGISDEIYVMYEGEISGHISGEEATEEKIMQFCFRKTEEV